ncbi:hypothetical protein [uncultured Pedobacter sp.]|uniref:hypothetical protein n=1 Tax=uncultured Pedobacter sp. TaxID=246139 RepID=UPI0025E6D495|nr:hypothetical protein [uncultured Pedobacter sp.]
MNTKIRPAGRIECNRENGSMPLLLCPDLPVEVCINPLIKIILQSKPLFTKALYSAAVPNTAFESQTVPPLYNRVNLMSSLPLNVGRQTARTSGRADGTHSRRQVSQPARKQERRNDGKRDSLLSGYHACVTDGMTNGTNARTQSCLIRCLNESIAAVPQGSRQSAIPASKPDSYPARKTAQNQDCAAESLQD